ADGSNGPPKNVRILSVPSRDDCVRHRHVDQGEQTGTVAYVVDVSRGDIPDRAVPKNDVITRPEQREFRVGGSSCAIETSSHRLNLVIGDGVLMAVERWRRPCAELISTFQCERSDVAQPGYRHWCERRLSWPPFA